MEYSINQAENVWKWNGSVRGVTWKFEIGQSHAANKNLVGAYICRRLKFCRSAGGHIIVLIDTITNGRKHQPGDPGAVDMPQKGGNPNLTDQDVKDLAAFIIFQNRTGEPPLSANELAKRTMLWVGIGIAAMVFITLLLAQYNMRWIARRAAARRK